MKKPKKALRDVLPCWSRNTISRGKQDEDASHGGTSRAPIETISEYAVKPWRFFDSKRWREMRWRECDWRGKRVFGFFRIVRFETRMTRKERKESWQEKRREKARRKVDEKAKSCSVTVRPNVSRCPPRASRRTRTRRIGILTTQHVRR